MAGRGNDVSATPVPQPEDRLLSRALGGRRSPRGGAGPDPRRPERTGDGPPTVTGKWTYRSFHSDPDLKTEPNDLLFGSGTLELTQPSPGRLAGTLGGDGWSLKLDGEAAGGAPATVRFTGKGTIGGEEWEYAYLGYVVPAWEGGVEQRPAIVGTIMRVKPHSGGAAKAGYVAQWIAVKQDGGAPGGPAGGGRAAPAGEEKRLREVEAKWAAAVGTNDPAQIGKFFTDDFLFVGAGGVLQDREEHLNDFKTKTLQVESVKVSEFTARVHGGFAVVNTLAQVKGKYRDRDISGDYRFMDAFKLVNSEWLAVARQQTRVAAPAPPGPTRSSKDVLRSREAFADRLRSASVGELRALSRGKLDASPRRSGCRSPARPAPRSAIPRW